MPLPGKDNVHMTKTRMLENIMVSLGGRIAEAIVIGDITTGASQDIKQATETARAMVTEYGMSEKVGMIRYGSDDDEVFIGRDLAHTRSYGESVATLIDSEIKAIIDDCYQKAEALIRQHEDVLYKTADLLMEREKIGREEFEALFD
jgi:cell division protease FtsH